HEGSGAGAGENCGGGRKRCSPTTRESKCICVATQNTKARGNRPIDRNRTARRSYSYSHACWCNQPYSIRSDGSYGEVRTNTNCRRSRASRLDASRLRQSGEGEKRRDQYGDDK